MSENYINVPVAEVRVGDEVRVDGFGAVADGECLELKGFEFRKIVSMDSENVSLPERGGQAVFRRSSIVAARRKVEPAKREPKVGEWRHGAKCAFLSTPGTPEFSILGRDLITMCDDPEVYRSTGWSADTRTGGRRAGDKEGAK